MSDRLALANAIEDAGIDRAKAERVASVIVAAIYDHAATKADVQASEAAVRADIAQLSATTRADLTTMRGAAQADVQAVRGEFAAFRSEVRADLARMDGKITALDAKIDTRFDQLGSRIDSKLPSWWQMPLVIGSTVTLLAALYAAAQFLRLHGWWPG